MNPANRAKVLADLRKKMAQASSTTRKSSSGAGAKLARPRVGVRGVSGRRGGNFTDAMIDRVKLISQIHDHPYHALAKRVATVLSASIEGRVQIEMYSQEHQSLVDIVNKVVEWDLKKTRGITQPEKIKLSLLQAKTLNEAYKRALRA
jgi:hypothetical protein